MEKHAIRMADALEAARRASAPRRGRRRRRYGRPSEPQAAPHEEPEINVVSLIDVVLLLVVFFILSANFTDEGRLRVRLPQASDVPPRRAERRAAGGERHAAGSYLVNERELINSSPETLRAAILKARRHRRAACASRCARTRRATHQSVITAMDVLGRLGFAEVNIATVKEEPAGKP